MGLALVWWCVVLLSVAIGSGKFAAEGRAVNISNTWTLPQEGFSVFYRYFRDKISWFEADAVCQFHHGNLVTVDNGIQFDATRAFLKELDVTDPVWIGLIRAQSSSRFMWTNSKSLDPNSAYWAESFPAIESPLCATTDPVRDFRWHALQCGGPVTASFLCELPVPEWGAFCTISAMPSVTIQYLSDSGTIQLTKDCGDDGERHMLCKGPEDHDKIPTELICTDGDNNQSSSIVIQQHGATTTHDDENVSMAINKIVTEIQSISSSDNNENNELRNLNAELAAAASVPKSEVDVIYQKDTNLITKKVKYLHKEKKANGKLAKEKRINKSIDEEEMMQGDDPKSAVLSTTSSALDSTEILQHVKKMLPQDLRKREDEQATSSTVDSKSTTNLPILTEDRLRRETQISETSISTEIPSTTIIQSDTTPSLLSTSSSTEPPETLLSSTENSLDINLTHSSEPPSNVITTSDATTAENLIPPTQQPQSKGTLIHPLHISSDMSKAVTQNPGPIVQKHNHTVYNENDDHFVPPMLLVKAKFTSSGKIHPEVYDPSLLQDLTPAPEHKTDSTTRQHVNATASSTTNDISKFYPASTEKQSLENEVRPTKVVESTTVGHLTPSSTTTSTEIPVKSTEIASTPETVNSVKENEFSDQTDSDDGNELQHVDKPHTHPLHAEYENSFSNIENYKPYRPNRRRALTKPESVSYLKKILG